MQNKGKIKANAVIFDFDNTLVDTRRAISDAYSFIFDNLSKRYSIPKERLLEEVRKAEKDLMANVIPEKRVYDRKAVLEEVNKRLSLGLEEEEINEFVDAFYRFIMENIHFPDYTEEVLKSLKARGKKLGLLTDRDYRPGLKKARLDKLGFTSLFDAVMIAGETIPEKKNSSIPFIELARKLNEKPSEIVAVGDRMDSDIDNAKEAGMKAILIDAFLEPNEGKHAPDRVIHDIRELLDIIE